MKSRRQIEREERRAFRKERRLAAQTARVMEHLEDDYQVGDRVVVRNGNLFRVVQQIQAQGLLERSFLHGLFPEVLKGR